MKPNLNQILVKPFPSDEETEGGIYVPESARKISNKVKIIDVGNGTKSRPMKLKKGQIGYRVDQWGCEVEINGEKHYIMDGGAILATE